MKCAPRSQQYTVRPGSFSIDATSWAPTWPVASIHTAATPAARLVFREEIVACRLAHTRRNEKPIWLNYVNRFW
jgi:hypothetical protein